MAAKHELMKEGIASLILFLIAGQPMYGYQVIKELRKRSEGYFKFKEGTLYPVLHRLEKAGLIAGQWQVYAGSRQRKYYSITAKGLAAIERKKMEWRDFLTAMNLIIQPLGSLRGNRRGDIAESLPE